MLITLRAERVNPGLFYRKYGRNCVCLIRVRRDTGFFFCDLLEKRVDPQSVWPPFASL